METWSARHLQDLLPEGEELEVAFPVRYPLGPLPFGMLLRGCIIALTNFRIVAFTKSDGEVRNLVVPKNRAEVHRFVAAVSG